MEIQRIIIAPSYKKENGLWVLHIDTSLLPSEFNLVEQSLVSIPPQEVGGNHKHPRQEAFIATSKNLVLYWLDKKGKHEETMLINDNLTIFIMPPYLPHAVFNKSTTSNALLYEFADDKQHNVETIKII